MSKTSEAFVMVAGLVVVIAMSYGFALLSEPRSVWLWRDMLGVIS